MWWGLFPDRAREEAVSTWSLPRRSPDAPGAGSTSSPALTPRYRTRNRWTTVGDESRRPNHPPHCWSAGWTECPLVPDSWNLRQPAVTADGWSSAAGAVGAAAVGGADAAGRTCYARRIPTRLCRPTVASGHCRFAWGDLRDRWIGSWEINWHRWKCLLASDPASRTGPVVPTGPDGVAAVGAEGDPRYCWGWWLGPWNRVLGAHRTGELVLLKIPKFVDKCARTGGNDPVLTTPAICPQAVRWRYAAPAEARTNLFQEVMKSPYLPPEYYSCVLAFPVESGSPAAAAAVGVVGVVGVVVVDADAAAAADTFRSSTGQMCNPNGRSLSGEVLPAPSPGTYMCG